jgi:hypothetical protein
MMVVSTALDSPEDLKNFEEWSPVISDLPENSANLSEVVSDTSSSEEQKKRVRSRMRPPPTDPPVVRQQTDLSRVIENWEGVVTCVEEDSFFASMRPTNSENERAEDEFEIDFDNVAEGDRELVREGAIFYLTVGVRRPRGQGPQKTTQIIFRRMPRWSPRDIERGEAAATELWEKLQYGVSTKAAVPYSEPR